jgi:hypothetical protein
MESLIELALFYFAGVLVGIFTCVFTSSMYAEYIELKRKRGGRL